MRDPFRVIWPVAILIVSISVACVSSDVYAQAVKAPLDVKPAFTLSITPVEPSVKAGSKVLVDVKAENISGHDISFGCSDAGDGCEYPMDVRDEKGGMAPKTKYGRVRYDNESAVITTGPNGSTTEVSPTFNAVDSTLNPGKSLTDRVSVSKVFILGEPGKYTIQVKQYDEVSKTLVISNKIGVTVTP